MMYIISREYSIKSVHFKTIPEVIVNLLYVQRTIHYKSYSKINVFAERKTYINSRRLFEMVFFFFYSSSYYYYLYYHHIVFVFENCLPVVVSITISEIIQCKKSDHF